jgi:hypothetical protein
MKKLTSTRKMICSFLLLVALQQYPLLAHNISWNKATLELNGDTLSLTLRMVQADLLGDVDPSRDSSAVLGLEAWKKLAPGIRKHVFGNIEVNINGSPVAEVVRDDWRLDDISSGGEGDTLMRMVEVSRAWHVSGPFHNLEFKPRLFGRLGLPVKWVVLVSTGFSTGRKLYQVIPGDGIARFDFDKRAGVNNSPGPESGRGKITLWEKIGPKIPIIGVIVVLLLFGAVMMRRFLPARRR